MVEALTYMVCTDCSPIIVNGDATHLDIYSEETAEEMLTATNNGIAEVQRRDGVYLSIGNPDNYESFSTNPCEVCADKRSGERIEVVGVPQHVTDVA